MTSSSIPQLYTTVDRSKLDASITELQQTARTATDVVEWVRDNLLAFGISPPLYREDTAVSLTFPRVPNLKDFDIANPLTSATIDIEVSDNFERHPLIDRRFNATGKASATQRMDFRIDMSFNDWPFLTCSLAMNMLNEVIEASSEEMALVELVLSKYLPVHFPGVTWDSLKALHAGDLLETGPIFGILEQEPFIEMLYSKRSPKSEVEVALPINISS